MFKPREGRAFEPFLEDIRRSPRVFNASEQTAVPPNIVGVIAVKPAGAPDSARMTWTSLEADEQFLTTYAIPLSAGRYFSKDFPSDPSTAVVINETAARALGPGSALGRPLELSWGPKGNFRETRTVIGIIRDFHGRSLHYEIAPLVVVLPRFARGYLSVKVRPNWPEAREFLVEKWKSFFPGVTLKVDILSDRLTRAYASESRLQLMTQVFTGTALFIGCLGLLGLVAFSTEQRRKEIGLRKVLGASTPALVGAFFQDFSKPILASSLAAWPLAYLIARNWLREFAYQTSLPAWLFLAGGALTVAISFLTVGLRVFRAARENPVDSLRYE